MKAGDFVCLAYGADLIATTPVPEPDVCDIGRKPRSHLSFGSSVHTTTSQHRHRALAVRIRMEELHRVVPDYARVETDLPWMPSSTFRSPRPAGPRPDLISASWTSSRPRSRMPRPAHRRRASRTEPTLPGGGPIEETHGEADVHPEPSGAEVAIEAQENGRRCRSPDLKGSRHRRGMRRVCACTTCHCYVEATPRRSAGAARRRTGDARQRRRRADGPTAASPARSR